MTRYEFLLWHKKNCQEGVENILSQSEYMFVTAEVQNNFPSPVTPQRVKVWANNYIMSMIKYLHSVIWINRLYSIFIYIHLLMVHGHGLCSASGNHRSLMFLPSSSRRAAYCQSSALRNRHSSSSATTPARAGEHARTAWCRTDCGDLHWPQTTHSQNNKATLIHTHWQDPMESTALYYTLR